MTDRRTGVSVPSFFTADRSVFDRVPIEYFQMMRGLNASFFENDGAYDFDDFFRYIGPSAPGTTNAWTLAGAGASIASAGTLATGVIRLEATAGAGSVAQLEAEYGSAGLRVQGNQIGWCASRFTPRDATAGAFFFGLGTPATADVFTALPTNGIFFFKLETETEWSFHVRSAGVSTIVTPFDVNIGNQNRSIGFLNDRRNFTPFWQSDAASLEGDPVIFDDDPNLASDTVGYNFYWAVRRGVSGDARMDIDWSFWGAQDFTD